MYQQEMSLYLFTYPFFANFLLVNKLWFWWVR